MFGGLREKNLRFFLGIFQVDYDTLTVRIQELNDTIQSGIAFGWVFLGFGAMVACGLMVVWFTLRGN